MPSMKQEVQDKAKRSPGYVTFKPFLEVVIMIQISENIIKVQDALKQMYSIEEYNRAIQKLKSKTNDPEVLAYMAQDMSLSYDIRLFAIAAMGN